MTTARPHLLGALALTLSDRASAAVHAGAGVSGSDAAALVTLRNYAEGEPLDLLRRALALSHPAVVRLADRLQARGLVDRHRGARDGRAVALRLTPAGRRAADAALAARADAIAAALAAARGRPARRPRPDARAHARRRDDGLDREPRHLPDVRPRRVRAPRPLPGDAGREGDRVAVRLREVPHGPLESRPLDLPLPATHKFPLAKYALLRARLEADGIARPDEIHECEPVPWAWIEAVQQPGLVERLRAGTLSVREQRGLGLPWSPALVERARRTTAGTVAAARRALAHGVGMNLGGGTHHAGHDFARGYCLFNDVAVALARVRADDGARRALVVDCDVHQGDGTAQVLGPDPEAFTVSLHGARNYPFQRIASDLDVDLPTGPVTRDYLRALDDALDAALPRAGPDIAFYLAGADPFEGDRLGRLALTKAGLRARDELVVERLRSAGAAVVVVLAGGYARDVDDTVDINAATAAVVAAADS